MRRFEILFFVLLVLPILTGHACAFETAEPDVLSEQRSAYGIEELEQYLPDEAQEIWSDLTIKQATHPNGLINTLWTYFAQHFGLLMRDALQSVLLILVLCMILSFVRSMPSLATHQQATEIIGAVCIAMLGMSQACSCIPEGIRIAESLSTFSSHVLPAVCAAATAAGAITSAGANYLIASVALELFGSAASTILLPALYLFAVAAVSGGVLQNDIMVSIAAFMKRILRLLLVCTAILFTTILSLSGALNGAADAAASKAVKTVVSTALPVVGGIVSDAADSISSGAGVLCSSAGIIGILCTAAICILPYCSYGIQYLLYQLIAELCRSFSGKRINDLLRCFSDLYGMLLGIIGTLSFIVFASIISLMRAAGKG